jgi:hypothetical protein
VFFNCENEQRGTGTYVSEEGNSPKHYFNYISKPLDISKAILRGRVIVSNTMLEKISN